MTYGPRRTARYPMGDISSVIGGAVSALAQVAGAANDPFAQEFVCRVRQVAAVELGHGIPACTRTPLSIKSPAGLKRPVVGMRGYVWAEQRKPWSYPAVIAVAVGVPFLLGYMVGRK